ncbi:MAG: hypothetical protein ACRELB_16720 [Polyangiaceae bacterium]
MSARTATLGIWLLLAALATWACSVPPSSSRYTPGALPDAATFAPVAELLDVRCGSLQCHGTIARNLRLYGSAGLRLSPGDRPLVPPCDTTDEIAQDYASVVGLEPEATSAVVASGDADPGSLTLVRKARGTEAHKGGTVWSTGDPSDVCLTSWLAGATDEGACASALASVLPDSGADPLLACLGPADASTAAGDGP